MQKGLRSPDPKIRKRANFARNVRKMNTGGALDGVLSGLVPLMAVTRLSDAETGLTNMGGPGTIQNFKMKKQGRLQLQVVRKASRMR